MRQFLLEKLRNLYWGIKGYKYENPPIPEKIESILFICKGNICRSPFAENYGRKIFNKNEKGDIKFYSAGLRVGNSIPPPQEAIWAAQNFGVDLKAHRAKKFDLSMNENANVIFAMEMQDIDFLKKNYPSLKNKLFLLPLFDDDFASMENNLKYNIPDPYGKDISVFISCYERIKRCIEKFKRSISNR